MAESLADRLGRILDVHDQRHRQFHAAEADQRRRIDEAHTVLARRQTLFFDHVRPLLIKAITEANDHMQARQEPCAFVDISGTYSGPFYVGCTPIAFKLQVGRHDIGEVLVVELTNDGMVDATFGKHWPVITKDFGWTPIPIDEFTEAHAEEIVLHYMNAVTARWAFGDLI